MKKIFIHIGMPKTGTTALQGFFYLNKNKLNEYDILYPIEWGGIPGGKYKLTDGNIGPFYENVSMSNEEKASGIMKLMNENNSILLSTERIWLRPIGTDFLKALKKRAGKEVEIILIVYLRRQIEYLESQYKQSIKHRKFTGSIWDFYHKNKMDELLDCKSILGKFEEIVGRNNLIVRVYEKEQFIGESIFSDFLYCLGIKDVDKFTKPSEYANVSLDNTTLELKKMLNRIDYSMEEINSIFYDILSDATVVKAKKSEVQYFETSVPLKDKIDFMKRYNDINSYVAQRYLNREKLYFQPLEECKEIDEEEKNKMLLQEVIYVFSSLIINLNRKIQKNTNEIKLLNKKEIAELRLEIMNLKKESNNSNMPDIGKELNEKEKIILEKNLEIERLKSRIEIIQGEITAIKSGVSWRITKPLRKVRRLIFKNL